MASIEYTAMRSDRWTPVWEFKTPRFRVVASVKWDPDYQFDGDDPEGEAQCKINSGEYIAFDSRVLVYLDGQEIGADYLSGSVYEEGKESEFWTAHRGADPMTRNCSLMRAERGNITFCHYFPSMVSEALEGAREYVRNMKAPPRIRPRAIVGDFVEAKRA